MQTDDTSLRKLYDVALNNENDLIFLQHDHSKLDKSLSLKRMAGALNVLTRFLIKQQDWRVFTPTGLRAASDSRT